MIVGILSDTHGQADMAALAVDLLLKQNAQYLIHCGDVGSTEVLDCLAGHPSMFVFGNTDGDRANLARYAKDIGVTCGNTCGKLAWDQKLAVVTHGDDGQLINRLLNEQIIDYLFVGHTHKRADVRMGKIRIINPGALQRAAEKTVALLDTVTDQLQFFTVSPPSQD